MELRACPYCGNTPELELFHDGFFDFSRIRCCHLVFDWCGDKTGDLITAAWNSRVETPEAIELAALKADIDAGRLVRVVRCKDCALGDSNGIKHVPGMVYCDHLDMGRGDDFYCAAGMRKEGRDG